jgi:hypothetical protein
MYEAALLKHIEEKYSPSSPQTHLPQHRAWYTYPLLDFLEDLDFTRDLVFEYGSGTSSIYWANKSMRVESVEHDYNYFNEAKLLMSAMNISNLNIRYLPDEALSVDTSFLPSILSYLSHDEAAFLISQTSPLQGVSNLRDLNHSISRLRNSGSISSLTSDYLWSLLEYEFDFDVIVVDGMNRCISGLLALKKIKDDGIIIVDNSDRPMYSPLKDLLQNSGFQEIPFSGVGPLNQYTWTTSIFIRDLYALRNRAKTARPGHHRIWF